jgi:hypothetical protein
MSHPPTLPVNPAGPSNLAELCLQHLEHEQAILQAALEALQEGRHALVTGNTAALTEAVHRQEVAADAFAALRLHRDEFRRTAAAVLGTSPHDITLRALSAALPGEAARFDAARERLARLAIQVRQLSSQNATLIHTCLDFVQRFLRDLTGAAAPTRYGRAGKMQESACGSLLQVRG